MGMHFGTDRGVHDIDIAGIFNFDQTRDTRPNNYPAHVMPPGTAVVIRGLESKPEFNGKSVKVRDWNEARNRYEVRLQDGSALSLRRGNLTQQCCIKVVSFAEKPELNGKKGEVIEYSEEKGCYTVLLHDPVLVIDLPPGSCLLAPGTCVVLHGLSDETLNGQMSQVLRVDHDAARYVVQSQEGRQVRVKFEK